jgi:hypothetical protein
MSGRRRTGIELRRVQVVDPQPARELTLVSPTGVRVEGASVTDVIAILQALS